MRILTQVTADSYSRNLVSQGQSQQITLPVPLQPESFFPELGSAPPTPGPRSLIRRCPMLSPFLRAGRSSPRIYQSKEQRSGTP